MDRREQDGRIRPVENEFHHAGGILQRDLPTAVLKDFGKLSGNLPCLPLDSGIGDENVHGSLPFNVERIMGGNGLRALRKIK